MEDYTKNADYVAELPEDEIDLSNLLSDKISEMVGKDEGKDFAFEHADTIRALATLASGRLWQSDEWARDGKNYVSKADIDFAYRELNNGLSAMLKLLEED